MATKPTPTPVEVGSRIHLALAAIIQDIVAIGKDRENTAQKFKYRGIDDIYNELHPIFRNHGVVCLPLVDRIDHSTTLKAGKNGDQLVSKSVVTVGYRFTAIDGSFLDAKMVGEGADFGDKATAKALTQAQKYLLVQTFLIPFANVEEGDMTSTADPRAELEALDEARRTRELDRQDSELLGKRENLQAQLEREGPPAGSTPVEEAPVPDKPVAKPAEKPAKASRKPASTPVEPETPKAPAEEPKGRSEAPVRPAWMDVVNKINLPAYKDKKVGDLAPEDVERLYVNWAMKKDFQEQIDLNPVRVELRAALIAAHAYHSKK